MVKKELIDQLKHTPDDGEVLVMVLNHCSEIKKVIVMLQDDKAIIVGEKSGNGEVSGIGKSSSSMKGIVINAILDPECGMPNRFNVSDLSNMPDQELLSIYVSIVS